MKPQPFRVVKSKLEKAGFVEVSQSGSHIKFARTTSDGTRTATIPKHREIAPGTLRSMPAPSGLERSAIREFMSSGARFAAKRADVSRSEREIDRLVYQLYELIDDEITIVLVMHVGRTDNVNMAEELTKRCGS